MGVIQQFYLKDLKLDKDNKYVHGLELNGIVFNMKYDFYCKIHHVTPNVIYLFNVARNQCLIMFKIDDGSRAEYTCGLMNFCVLDDMPHISSHFLYNQDAYTANILKEFKDKYATYLLENAMKGP